MRWLNGMLVIDTEKKAVINWLQLSQEEKFPAEGKPTHGITLSGDGFRLYLTSQTRNSVSIVNTKTLQVEKEISVGTDPNWIDFLSAGKYAVVSNTGSNTVSIIDLQKQEVVKTIPVGAAPKRLKVATIKN
jgi:YVTN family beta-propeller protein